MEDKEQLLLTVNQQFFMKSKLDNEPRLFQFLGYEGDSCYNMKIQEVETGSISMVEAEWFIQREIKFV